MAVENNDVELARLRYGAAIVGGSILAAVATLSIVTYYLKPTTASEAIAFLSTITGFLGAAVGILFGVNAGGSARAQATEATAQIGAAASKVADAAKATADSAQETASTAARTVEASHAALRELASQSRGTFGAAIRTTDSVVPQESIEDLAGDPDDVHTRMALSMARTIAIDSFTRGVVHIANPASAEILFAERVTGVADGEAADGVSRSTNRARVTEYLNLLGLDFLDEHGVPTRYCAAGVTWAACKAYCDLNAIGYTDSNRLPMLRSVLGDIGRHYFKPSAGCQAILDDAKARGTFMPKSQVPQPGYLVFYNWEEAEHAEHIGIVEGQDAAGLRTVEFNTTAADGPNQGNGGAVSKKSRAMKYVLGYAKTY